MVDQLAVDAGSLEGKVTSLAKDMLKKKIYMLRDKSLEKSKRTKNIGNKGLNLRQRGGPRSSQ